VKTGRGEINYSQPVCLIDIHSTLKGKKRQVRGMGEEEGRSPRKRGRPAVIRSERGLIALSLKIGARKRVEF